MFGPFCTRRFIYTENCFLGYEPALGLLGQKSSQASGLSGRPVPSSWMDPRKYTIEPVGLNIAQSRSRSSRIYILSAQRKGSFHMDLETSNSLSFNRSCKGLQAWLRSDTSKETKALDQPERSLERRLKPSWYLGIISAKARLLPGPFS